MFHPKQDSPVKKIRRCTRNVVCIPATLSDLHRAAIGAVTNISEAGCAVRLSTPISLSQYLTLKLYPQAGTTALQVAMAEIRWVEREWVGVGFVYLSQEDKAKLQRLCREHAALALGDHHNHFE